MSTTTETARSHWDLSRVLDFVNTLPPSRDVATPPKGSLLDLQVANGQRDPSSSDAIGLGDFSKVWRFLGTPNDTANLPPVPSKEDYASDGATYTHKTPVPKAPSIGTDGEDLTASASDTPTLTKTQRKKLRRKERKAAEEIKRIQQATVSESEAEYAGNTTPARKASAHVVPGKITALQTVQRTIRDIKDTRRPELPQRTPSRIKAPVVHAPATDSKINDGDAVNAVAKAMAALRQGGGELPSTPTPKGRPHTRHTPRSFGAAVQFTPSSVQPLPTSKAVTSFPPQSPQTRILTPAMAKTSLMKSYPVIEPAIVRSGEDRQWALLLKIINDFSDDRKYLVSPMNMTTHNNDPKGIHVFVDASNIFIGFMDQLKRSRNIHPLTKVPEVHLSFDALALLMERRRPVARRILAGSTPHIPAFDTAKAVGYECSILEKVYKARELTERQIYFKELDARRLGKTPKRAPSSNAVNMSNGTSSASRFGDVSGTGSGSETNTPQYAPPKMIEQGVDEILHLKILESVVDSEEPSTIVLATGDAAAAEYSDGFMAMVSRALKKGWKVELVSWSKNISGMYKKTQWMNTWGDHFRIVYLDDYAEELLDM